MPSVGHTEPNPLWRQGWWLPARHCPSPNFNARPEGSEVSLIVIHSISLPPGVFGGDSIEQLFTNRLDWDADPYFQQIRGLQVSAHFLIRRGGECVQFVPCDQRAWHAGASSWQGRDNCNDFSIGIELEGVEGDTFEAAQYDSLLRLVRGLAARYAIGAVAGHEHVAPGRKGDPGTGFSWSTFARQLGWPSTCFPEALLLG